MQDWQSLQANSPSATQVDKSALHIGAVAFIHRLQQEIHCYLLNSVYPARSISAHQQAVPRAIIRLDRPEAISVMAESRGYR